MSFNTANERRKLNAGANRKWALLRGSTAKQE